MYDNKTILITGGTGSFGQNFARFLLTKHKPKKVIVFSRDELKQFKMQQEFSKYKNLRFFLGDIRDLARLKMAFTGVDIVVHAAALKQVPALEYNPFEAIQTNVLGSQNVVSAALSRQVKKVLLISTDKAAQPINLYGATKMCAEKLFIASNAYSSEKNIVAFSAVRYGNVIGSRGSIVETILNNKSNGALDLTHKEMTRFWITLDQCFALVTFALTNMNGGEVFIPKVPSMKVSDLFKTIAPNRPHRVIGIRPGEKLHEVLLTNDEATRAYDLGKHFVILPSICDQGLHRKYQAKGKIIKGSFVYTSDTNQLWLKPEELIRIIAQT